MVLELTPRMTLVVLELISIMTWWF